MSSDYSQRPSHELEQLKDIFLAKKHKLSDTEKEINKTIRKETIWLKNTIDNNSNLVETTTTVNSMKSQLTTNIQSKEEKYEKKRESLFNNLQEQENLELQSITEKIKLKYEQEILELKTIEEKIKVKYQQKYNELDSVVEKYLTNETRKVEALERKIQTLEHSITAKRDKLTEEKTSKILINAKTDLSSTMEELEEVTKKIDTIDAELAKRRRRPHF